MKAIKNKKLKGMTLVEIIIAMAVMTIASSVLVTACVGVSKMKVSTNALHKKINYESPVADSRTTSSVKVDEVTGQKIVLKYNGVPYEIPGSVCEVKEETGFSNYGEGVVNLQGNHNFKFFVAD